ncbi:uncharacterized protein PG986_011730 [Apiospora aurea]|uniref:DUF1996 domain-containing protein n=1 Tax=Apiospora aurea TaxID=335848 RepID=A0ABR1PXY8_9PEZI
MQWKSPYLAAAAVMPYTASAQFATAAMMRFQCSRLVVERVDPLVTPGMVQSPHIHQIVGGNSFNATMTPVDYDPSEESTCTTCDYSEDFSNYWTANLYFKARNGTYKRVKQMVNLGLQGTEGMTVYYIPPYDGKTTVTAFKPVMYEVMWDTREFNDKSTWPEDGSQPFVYSMNDETGYGWHGDYLFGWKGDALQRGLDARCFGNACAALETQRPDDSMACTKRQTVPEDVDGWLEELPSMVM